MFVYAICVFLIKRSFVPGLFHGPVEHATHNHSEVFQGQEKWDTGVQKMGALKTPLSHLIPQNPSSNNKAVGLGNQLQFSVHVPFFPCPSGTVLFPGGNIERLGLPNCYCPVLSSYGDPENTTRSRNLSVPRANSYNSGLQDLGTSELKDANEVQNAPPNGGGRYMLFGVDLVKSPQELPSPQVATYSDHESLYSVPPMSQSSVSEPSKSISGVNSENQCKNCCSATNHYCTKVHYSFLLYSFWLGLFNVHGHKLDNFITRLGTQLYWDSKFERIIRSSNMELLEDQLTWVDLMDIMISFANLIRCLSSKEA